MSEERKAWVVTSGSYSDYSIEGVFTTREKAQAFADWENGPNRSDDEAHWDYQVEGFPLDEPVGDTGAFRVYEPMEGELGRWHRNGIWNARENPSRPAQFMKGHGHQVDKVVAYGRTVEHARRSAREFVRAIRAGTHLIDGKPWQPRTRAGRREMHPE